MSRSDRPFYRVHRIANPNAGAEFILQAPGSGLWRVVSLAFALATSAVVGSRRVSLRADDGTSTFFLSIAATDVAAGASVLCGAFAGGGVAGLGTEALTLGLPTDGLYLAPGFALRTVTDAIDVGDQYSAIVAQLQEFPIRPAGDYLPGMEPDFVER